jgi:N-carbamoylputrescine amidase
MIKVAGIQMSCSKEPKANLEKAVEMASLAADRGAKIIGFPQLFTLPWFAFETRKEPFRLAEEIQGPTVGAFQAFAKEHRVVVVCSVFERDGAEHYNTAVVIEQNGQLAGRYRKVHVPQIPLWEERSYFKPGDLGFPVIKTSYARIGVQICWDNFFPEGTRILALRGAQIVFAPTASAFASQSRWERMICANAIANNLFIFRINRVGKEERQKFYGKSFCANPYGELMGARAGSEDAILFSDIDLDEVAETREIWTFFKDRRPELYGELSGP